MPLRVLVDSFWIYPLTSHNWHYMPLVLVTAIPKVKMTYALSEPHSLLVCLFFKCHFATKGGREPINLSSDPVRFWHLCWLLPCCDYFTWCFTSGQCCWIYLKRLYFYGMSNTYPHHMLKHASVLSAATFQVGILPLHCNECLGLKANIANEVSQMFVLSHYLSPKVF